MTGIHIFLICIQYNVSNDKIISFVQFSDECLKHHNILYIIGTHARYVVVRTDAFLEQSIANLPREYRRTFAFVLRYLGHDFGCRHPRLRASDRSGPDGTSLVIPTQNRSKPLSTDCIRRVR